MTQTHVGSRERHHWDLETTSDSVESEYTLLARIDTSAAIRAFVPVNDDLLVLDLQRFRGARIDTVATAIALR